MRCDHRCGPIGGGFIRASRHRLRIAARVARNLGGLRVGEPILYPPADRLRCLRSATALRDLGGGRLTPARICLSRRRIRVGVGTTRRAPASAVAGARPAFRGVLRRSVLTARIPRGGPPRRNQHHRRPGSCCRSGRTPTTPCSSLGTTKLVRQPNSQREHRTVFTRAAPRPSRDLPAATPNPRPTPHRYTRPEAAATSATITRSSARNPTGTRGPARSADSNRQTSTTRWMPGPGHSRSHTAPTPARTHAQGDPRAGSPHGSGPTPIPTRCTMSA